MSTADHAKATAKPRRPRRAALILVPLAAAALSAMAYGVANRWVERTTADVAAALVQNVQQQADSRLRSFFEPIPVTLRLIRDWSEDGSLDRRDEQATASQLAPLMVELPHIAAVILADETGREFFLRREGESWLVRIRTSGDATDATLLTTRWPPETPERTAKESRLDYDPRDRPWFADALNVADPPFIHWTTVYTFYATGEPGISAALSWPDPEATTDDRVVGALDVRLTDIAAFLSQLEVGAGGLAFLTSPEGQVLLPNRSGQDGAADLVPVGEHGVGAVADAYSIWLPNRDGPQMPFAVTSQGERWWASFAPFALGSRTLWLGVLLPEQDLLDRVGSWPRRLEWVFLCFGAIATAGAYLVARRLAAHRVYDGRGSDGQQAVGDAATDPFGPERIFTVIKQGESELVEFKSTIRLNLKTGKPGKEMEIAWLKTVVAFLNTDGGQIFLGVADDGELLGLASDGFASDDHALRHIDNLIEQHIGGDAFAFVRTRIVRPSESAPAIALIYCRPLPSPAFLKVGKDEEFYVRTGPASRKLPPSRILSYLETRPQSEAKRT